MPICVERLHALTLLLPHHTRYPQHAHINEQGRSVTANTIVLMPYNLSKQHWVMLKFDVENKAAQVFDSIKDVNLSERRCAMCNGTSPQMSMHACPMPCSKISLPCVSGEGSFSVYVRFV